MAIYNLGSINIDNFYQVPHIPAPGETIAAGQMSVGLGGKGANISVAAARGAARVVHIGAIGPEGAWARDRLTEYGVDKSIQICPSVATATDILNMAVLAACKVG